MNPSKKNKDMASKVDVEVGVRAGTEAVDAEMEVVVESPDEVAEAGSLVEAKEKGVKKARKTKKVNFKTLAEDLYYMGLDLDLRPDEAALLTSETKLPPFISDEGQKEFRDGVVDAYQEMRREAAKPQAETR